MAVSETLTYEFNQSGLQQLRRAFGRVQSDLEDMQQEVQQAAAQLEELTRFDDADFSRRVRRAEGSIADLGREGQEAAQQMERAYADSVGATTERIEGMQEALSSFTLSDAGVDLTGAAGGGGGIGSLVAAAGAGAAAGRLSAPARQLNFSALNAEAERFVSIIYNVERKTGDVREEVAALADEFRGKLGELARVYEELGGERAGRVADAFREISEGAQASLGSIHDDMIALADGADDASGSLLSMSGITSRLGSALGSTGAKALGAAGAVAAFAAAAAGAAKQVADFSAEMAVYGQQLTVAEAQSGASVETIQEIYLAASALDSEVELDTIRDAFKELSLRTQDALEGAQEAQDGFRRLGLTMDQLREMERGELFEEVLRRMRRLSAEQRILTAEQIAGGEAGERLARVFALQEGELDKLMETTRDNGLTAGQIEQLDEMRIQYNLIQQQIEKIRTELALAFGPTAIQMLENMVSIADKMARTFRKVVDGFIWSLDKLSGRYFARKLGAPKWFQNMLMGGPIGLLATDWGDGDFDASPTTPDRAPARPRAPQAAAPEDTVLGGGEVELLDLYDFSKLLDQPKIGTIEVDPSEALRQLLERNAFFKSRSQDVPGPGYYEEMGRALRRSGQVGTVRMLGQAWRDVKAAIDESLEWTVRFASYDLGRSAADGLFSLFSGGGLSGSERADLELRLEQINQEEWALRESLREREMSYEEYHLRVQQLGYETSEITRALAEETESVWKRAFRTLGRFVADIMKQIVAQITAALAQALALKAISSIFGVGPGGSFGQLFAGALGLTEMASGAVAYGPTPALVGEYPGARSNPELIAPADKMQGYIREAVAQAGAGGAQHIYIQGSSRVEGGDIVTSYDATARRTRRKGHRGRA